MLNPCERRLECTSGKKISLLLLKTLPKFVGGSHLQWRANLRAAGMFVTEIYTWKSERHKLLSGSPSSLSCNPRRHLSKCVEQIPQRIRKSNNPRMEECVWSPLIFSVKRKKYLNVQYWLVSLDWMLYRVCIRFTDEDNSINDCKLCTWSI